MAVLRTGLGLQGALTAVFALVLLLTPGALSPPLYVTLSGLAMAGILFASRQLSSFLKIFEIGRASCRERV